MVLPPVTHGFYFYNISAHYVPYVKYGIQINNVVYSWHLAVTQSPLLY